MHRSHTCWELNASNVGQQITLAGWVSNRRDHGWIIFIDLRDRYGVTQVVFDPADNKQAWEIADSCRSEYVIKLTWSVRPRPAWQENSKLSTWEIEVIVSEIEILSKSKTPPFEISDYCDAWEDIRFKHRYLDLRRKKVAETVQFRAKFNLFTRNWFTNNEFIEVQTPIFTVSSPEWARDYLIPSRVNPGKFYALPQAPQQYKQLLMVGWFDKYFQIAPCFRDEDPRADRHSCEFYQIDCEMSFVEQEDVFKVAESFLLDLIPAVSPEKTIVWGFKRMTHKEAKDLYGSDKPDLRFDMHFEDFTNTFANSDFSVFKAAVETGWVVKAMKLEWVNMSRKEIDDITQVAINAWAKWLAYIIYEAEWARSPILKFFSEAEIKELENKLQPKVGDMIFFWAWDYSTVTKVLGTVRVALRDKYNLVNKDELAFCWVTDFPMFEQDEATGKIDFEHNPFSMPNATLEDVETKNPLEIYGRQYDLACNGYEILSWSIRNHNLELLTKLFEITGRSEKEVKDKFWAMYNAFQFWVPPHGWFAFWADRLMMILKNEENIREMYAFPKSGKAEDVMMWWPSYVDEAQLRELHIELDEQTKEEIEARNK